MSKDKIIEKILLLTEITEEAGAFEGEIANASAAIQRLMDRHSIEWAEIHIAKDSELEAEFISATADDAIGNTLKWHWDLARLIARITHTKSYRQSRYNADGVIKTSDTYSPLYKNKAKKKILYRYRQFSFYGTKQNVELATSLFSKWIERLDVMSVIERIKYSKEIKEGKHILFSNPRVFRTSWLDGCLDAIRSKVAEQEKQREVNVSSALVLYNDKVAEEYGKFSKGFGSVRIGGPKRFSDAGYNSGNSYGEQINIGVEEIG